MRRSCRCRLSDGDGTPGLEFVPSRRSTVSSPVKRRPPPSAVRRTCELQVLRACALVPGPPQQNPCLLDKRLLRKSPSSGRICQRFASVAKDSECPDHLLQTFRALSNFRVGHQNESRRCVAHQGRELRLGKRRLSPAEQRLVFLRISKQLTTIMSMPLPVYQPKIGLYY